MFAPFSALTPGLAGQICVLTFPFQSQLRKVLFISGCLLRACWARWGWGGKRLPEPPFFANECPGKHLCIIHLFQAIYHFWFEHIVREQLSLSGMGQHSKRKIIKPVPPPPVLSQGLMIWVAVSEWHEVQRLMAVTNAHLEFCSILEIVIGVPGAPARLGMGAWYPW